MKIQSGSIPRLPKNGDFRMTSRSGLKIRMVLFLNFPIKVRVTERIRWDSVYMVHGFGHAQKADETMFWQRRKRYTTDYKGSD